MRAKLLVLICLSTLALNAQTAIDDGVDCRKISIGKYHANYTCKIQTKKLVKIGELKATDGFVVESFEWTLVVRGSLIPPVKHKGGAFNDSLKKTLKSSRGNKMYFEGIVLRDTISNKLYYPQCSFCFTFRK